MCNLTENPTKIPMHISPHDQIKLVAMLLEVKNLCCQRCTSLDLVKPVAGVNCEMRLLTQSQRYFLLHAILC